MGRPRLIPAETVLREVERLIAENDDVPPTIEELREALGVGSKRTVLRYLCDLEDRGWIRRWSGARGIKVVDHNGQRT